MKLAAVIEEPRDGWAAELDYASFGIQPILLSAEGVDLPASSAAANGTASRLIRQTAAGARTGLAVPDLASVLATLEELAPDGCLIPRGGVLGQVVTLAADLVGMPVFRLVNELSELENLGRREKRRPDLFFLTSSALLERSLADPRYGSTLLPTGHPRYDCEDVAAGRELFGGGEAGKRMLTFIRRWQDDELQPPVPQLSIVVPCYREAENLPTVCDRLLAVLDREWISAEIILVDDASPDATYQVALRQMWRSPRIRAFTKPLPRGMGNAIIHGVKQARASVITVTMGDGSDDVEMIPQMFRAVKLDGWGLAIGSRYRYRRNYETVPRMYRFWSRCFRITASAMIGFRLTDYTNAFRTFDRRIIDRFGLEGGGFEISPETTFKAWFASRRVTEIDVRHLKRAAGQSSFSFLKAGPGYGKMLLKALACRLTGRWITLDW